MQTSSYLPRLLATCVTVLGVALATPPASAEDKGPPGPEITLVESGSGPRTPLRYAYQKGATTSWKVRIESSMSLSGQKSLIPVVVFASDLTVVGVDRKGTATCDFAIREARYELAGDTPPEALKKINAKLDVLKQISGQARFDSQGRLLSYKRKKNKAVPAKPEFTALLATFDQQFRKATVPLPEAPVGEGARWKVTRDVVSDNMKLSQENVYSLVQRDDRKGAHTVAITIRQTQSSPQQRVMIPGVPPSMETTLLNADGEGKSTVTILSDRIGANGKSDIVLSLAVEMRMGKQSGKAAVKVNRTVALLAGVKPSAGTK